MIILGHTRRRIYFFFSRCDRALPAMLFVRLLERPSRKAADACFATFVEVTFFAIHYNLVAQFWMNLPPSLASPLLVGLSHRFFIHMHDVHNAL